MNLSVLSSNQKKTKTPATFGGAMIIAGTAIGAGMLSLPIVTSGMWFIWAIPAIFFVWLCMYTSGLFILEANLHYPTGSHLATIAKDCLHPIIARINSAALLFVLYILTYAYITIGSPFLQEILNHIGISLPSKITALLYVFICGAMVIYSTKAVDRITTIVLMGMVLAFLLSLPSLLSGVRVPYLLNYIQPSPHYYPYITAGLASIVAAFGYHGNVSSLVKYYEKDHQKVKQSLFYGTLITVIIYALWITGAQGSLGRDFFQEKIISAENSVIELINQLNISVYLKYFSNFAILSSFLGVTLGLFDFIADSLKLNNHFSGRIKTGLITFLPPLILALLFPYGFIVAIGFAGLLATIWAVIVPALMVLATRIKYPANLDRTIYYRAWGGKMLPYFIIVFGVLMALSEIMALFNILPKYK